MIYEFLAPSQPDTNGAPRTGVSLSYRLNTRMQYNTQSFKCVKQIAPNMSIGIEKLLGPDLKLICSKSTENVSQATKSNHLHIWNSVQASMIPKGERERDHSQDSIHHDMPCCFLITPANQLNHDK